MRNLILLSYWDNIYTVLVSPGKEKKTVVKVRIFKKTIFPAEEKYLLGTKKKILIQFPINQHLNKEKQL